MNTLTQTNMTQVKEGCDKDVWKWIEDQKKKK